MKSIYTFGKMNMESAWENDFDWEKFTFEV